MQLTGGGECTNIFVLKSTKLIRTLQFRMEGGY